jgi:Dinitrogenase iron-molybdenum cofactor.
MIPRQAFITLCGDAVAPRFDMTAEGLVVSIEPGVTSSNLIREQGRHLVLAHTSSEELCDVITRAGVTIVVCGGIEEDYYHYLRWKRIEVVSDVMGPLDAVLARQAEGKLQPGDCLFAKRKSG